MLSESWSEGLFEEGEESFDPRPAARPAPSGATPVDRDALLAQASRPRLAIYELVRRCLDDFERVAPWSLLYYPPEEAGALVAMVDALIGVIEDVPQRIAGVLGEFPEEEIPGSSEPIREDVDFLFSGIHSMVKHDLKRLESTVVPFRTPGATPPSAEESLRLCEQSADLKGKYASALMGATASLLSEGSWNGVEIEPVLFPEKAEEFRGTRELVDNLRAVLTAIRQLPESVPFRDLLDRWKQSQRVDPYGLADLATLRGRIGSLLRERNRRALYSGDYHQIRKREMQIADRLSELEVLHRKTWSVSAREAANDLAAIHTRLERLVLEIAAVLDVELLKGLIGDKQVLSLRARLTSGGARPSSRSGPQDSLLPLLAEDDLRIFFEMLLGSVTRRACLHVAPPAPAEETASPEVAPATVVEAPPLAPPPLPEPTVELFPIEAALPPPIPPFAPVIPGEPKRPAQSRPAPAAPPAALPIPIPPRDLRPLLDRIRIRLVDLQSPGNPHWNEFRMTQRLISKKARIPAAMFQSIHPFVRQILEELVPDLRDLAPYGQITQEVVRKLAVNCLAVLEPDLTPAQIKDEVPVRLERLLRFLEALRSVIPAN
jgi:hypothetical protein